MKKLPMVFALLFLAVLVVGTNPGYALRPGGCFEPGGPGGLEFDTELVSLNLTGGPFPMPLASDPGNLLGDSVEGYGFVNSEVTITLSSQRAVDPGPPSPGTACAFVEQNPEPLDPPIDPDELDGEQFFVDSFFDVFFDITVTDVDPRPGRDFAGQPDGASFLLPDNGPAHMSSFYLEIFDKDAPNFGLIPPPEADPYIGHFNIEIPLGGDINGNGENDKIKFTLATHSAGDANRTFVTLPDGTVIDEFDSAAFLEGAVVDESADPPFTIGAQLPSGLPDPAAFGGPTTATSTLLTAVVDCGSAPVCVFIPDTLVFPGSTLRLPVVADTVNCLGIVSVELDITYGDTLAHPFGDTLVDYTGALTDGWANEHNVLPGVSDTTNLVLVGIATDNDTLTGPPHGALAYLELSIDDSIYCPDSTYIDLIRVLLNDGIPLACTPQGGWVKIRGESATIATAPDTIYPRNTVTITVNDPDENRDSGSVDTISVTVTGGGDIDMFLLAETGISTGVFEGMAATEFDPSAGTPYDGTLGVVAGDTVIACYSDCLDSLGNTVEVCAETHVIGGEDGTIEATYVVATYPDRDGAPDTVRVEVSDLDELVTAGDNNDTVPVQLVDGSVAPADTEDVFLADTLSVFRGRVPTVQGPAGVSGDGDLTLNTLGADLDTIATTYIDTLTAAGGYDTLTAITYVVNRFGDVSANERVGAFDAHLELDFAVGNTVASLREWLVADVDGDSTLLAFDASLILRYVVRLDDSFPVHTYTVRDPKNHPFLKAIGGEMIAFGDAQRQSDGTYLVPMTLADRSEIVSGTFWLSHGSGMEVLGVTTGAGYDDFIVAHNPQTEVLRVAFAGAASSVEGSGEVLWIRVRADEDASLWFGVDDAALNGYRMPMSDAGMFDVSVVEVPETYALHPNVPNPFNPQTTIRYDVPSESRVDLVVYNLMGQTVRVLVDGDQVAGRHEVVWDGRDALGRDVGSGMYLLRMQAGSFSESRKMLLLR